MSTSSTSSMMLYSLPSTSRDNTISISWDNLPSTSRDYLPSTSRDCLPSTSRDCLPSTSRDCLPSTSRDCLASTSRDCLASTSRDCLASTSRDCLPSTSRQNLLPRDCLPSTSRQNLLPRDCLPSTSRQNLLLRDCLPSTSRQHLLSPSTPWDSVSSTTSQNSFSIPLPQAMNGIAPTEINYRTLTLELDNVCRVCLFQDENNEMFVNILGNENLLNDVHAYYHIQVQSTDSRSKMICRKCIHYIDEWHQRTKTAIDAQLIQDYLTKKAIEKAAKSGKNTLAQTISANELVQSYNNTGDEIYLQSHRDLVDHPEELQDSSSVETTSMKLFCKTRSATLRLQSQKDTCIFCTGNNKHLKFDFRKKLCDKHSKPHTCLCQNCIYVFPNIDLFLVHYRYHMNLKKNHPLCRVCYKVLNSSKTEKAGHRHQNMKHLFMCCSMSFLSMTDFVLHKLKKHKAKIVMTLKEVKNTIRMHGNSLPTYISDTSDTSYEHIDQLFTCLEPNCDKVFNSMSNNCDHYRQHANVPEEYYLCRFCLNKYDSESDFKLQCSHINPSIMCHLCDVGFTSLHDLAKHKLYIHNAVVLCGEDNTPGCPVCFTILESNAGAQDHYVACYNMETKNVIVDNNAVNNRPLEPVNLAEYTESLNINGSYMCKCCTAYCHSLEEYVEHSRKKHRNSITLKDDEIKLCPLCDKNYTYLNFVSHVETCTMSMKIKSDDASVELFGCVYCKTVFTVFSAIQFRTHVLFCKSFQEHIFNGKRYFQCVNCNFKSSYHPKCVAHANIYCIYFQLKMKYAMSADEKLKVEQRIELLKADCDDNLQSVNIPPVVITIDHPANVLSDNNEIHWNKNPNFCCSSTNFRNLSLYNYLCNYCTTMFFDEFVFKHHLNKDGKPCRMKLSWYCTQCLLDYDDECQYRKHLTIGFPFLPVSMLPLPLGTLKKELLAEDSASELSDDEMRNSINENNIIYDNDDTPVFQITDNIPTINGT